MAISPLETEQAATAPAPTQRRPIATSPFRSLRNPEFRNLWFGTLVSSSGDWMDQIALNWLVLTMTDSAVYLGILQFCRGLPIVLFTLIGGAIADRFERHRVMMVSQTVAMILAFVLALIAQFGGSIWMVLLVAALRGTALSFNLPARQALISQLVPREDLMSAISVNSMTLNLSRIVGPAIGGVLIATVGVAGAFYVNGASFLAVIFALSKMAHIPAPKREPEQVLKSVASGLRYAWRDDVVRSLLFVALVPLIVGMSYQPIISVFARDVLNIGSVGLGYMTSAAGLGAIIGSLTAASITGSLPRGWYMFGGVFIFGFALVAFANSTLVPLSLLALVFVGIGSSSYQSVNNTLLQQHTPDSMRGRIMSLLFLQRGLIPLGSLIAGFGIQIFGPAPTMTVFGITLILLGAAVAVASPTVRRLT